MAYEKFDPDKSDIKEIAIKYNGNVNAIARHYNINHDTIYQYFKRDPQGKKIIDDVRKYNTDLDIDLAEYVNRFNMQNYKNNAGLAQRAAEKVIDKKGHLRGWGVDVNDIKSPNQDDIDKDHKIMQLEHKIALLEANGNKSQAE